MNLIVLRLPPTEERAARQAAAALEEIAEPAALAVSVHETAARSWVAQAYYHSDTDRLALKAALDIAAPEAGAQVTIEPVPDVNWVALSQAGLPPVEAGRFVVHGGHDRERARARRLAIEIEAGEAFGTAHHASTRGCLMALDRLARRRSFARVLDLGCGSGVLAIAAARLMPGAAVHASDNDPEAVRVARENVVKNGVARRVHPLTAAGLAHPALRRRAAFDLVLANILARPLIALAPAISAALAPGGMLILSGILSPEAPRVLSRYGALGLVRCAVTHENGWAALVLTKPGRTPP